MSKHELISVLLAEYVELDRVLSFTLGNKQLRKH